VENKKTDFIFLTFLSHFSFFNLIYEMVSKTDLFSFFCFHISLLKTELFVLESIFQKYYVRNVEGKSYFLQ